MASLSSHSGLCRDIDAVCDAQAISCPLLPVAPTVFSLRGSILGDCLVPEPIRQPLTRSELVQGVQPAPTGRNCVFQHLPLWKAQAFFLQASVVLMPSTLHGKEKKRKDYAFRRQFNEKPSIIPGCPGIERYLVDSSPPHCSSCCL